MAYTQTRPAASTIHWDYGFLPWLFTIITFGLWAVLTIFTSAFGGWRAYHYATAVGAPGAVATTPESDVWYRRSSYVTDALRTLLWLMFVPTVINHIFGFTNIDARNLLIAVFAIGLVWAILRGLGHIMHFLHRVVDILLFVIVPMAIAAAALGFRYEYPRAVTHGRYA
jgi:hypothetical protein